MLVGYLKGVDCSRDRECVEVVTEIYRLSGLDREEKERYKAVVRNKAGRSGLWLAVNVLTARP
jgi:hypothetical protein